jgi:ribosomal silencing factor RsfS
MKEIESMEANEENSSLFTTNEEEEDMLVEDQESSNSHDKFQKHFEVRDFIDETSTSDQKSEVPDWLSTRRAKLSRTSAIDMMTPDDARKKQRDSEIPVIKHTLLSSQEIISCLVNGGAQDVKLITPEKEMRSYLAWKGLIIATGTSYSHIRILTDTIVHNLRKRGLAECGVIGAKYGSEGGEDLTTSRHARRRRNIIGRGKSTDDGWISVDCRNYIVHVQDEITRKSVDLEGLWKPGSEQAKILRSIDSRNEDAIDDFVASNPVPEGYMESMKIQGDFWGADGRGGYVMNKQQSKKNGRFTPASNQTRKQKNRGRY